MLKFLFYLVEYRAYLFDQPADPSGIEQVCVHVSHNMPETQVFFQKVNRLCG